MSTITVSMVDYIRDLLDVVEIALHRSRMYPEEDFTSEERLYYTKKNILDSIKIQDENLEWMKYTLLD